MPVYEYQCKACSHEFEREQRITEDAIKTCPKCKANKARRLISRTSFVLKGGGWYSDLYSSSGKDKGSSDSPNSGSSGSDSAGSSSAGGDSASSKSDSKSDSKANSKSDKKPSKKDSSGGDKGGKAAKPSKAPKGSKAA